MSHHRRPIGHHLYSEPVAVALMTTTAITAAAAVAAISTGWGGADLFAHVNTVLFRFPVTIRLSYSRILLLLFIIIERSSVATTISAVLLLLPWVLLELSIFGVCVCVRVDEPSADSMDHSVARLASQSVNPSIATHCIIVALSRTALESVRMRNKSSQNTGPGH